MIEDELRSLLTERAADLPDRPARAVEVRSRIAGIRRRRVAGAALGLVLLAVAGLAVLRLPATNESLPPGTPAPPYYDRLGKAKVPGYTDINTATPGFTGPEERFLFVRPGQAFRYLLVARCPRPAPLTLRGLGNGATVTANCSRPVGDHFEGAVAFAARRADVLFEETQDGTNVRYEPGSAGPWEAAVLESNDADRLATNISIGRPWLAEGVRTRSGTTVEVTVPPYRDPQSGLDVTIECIAGVRLAFSVPRGPLGTADCDPLVPPDQDTTMTKGRLTFRFERDTLDQRGLEPGLRVPLTIRAVGRDTDQWRVFPLD